MTHILIAWLLLFSGFTALQESGRATQEDPRAREIHVSVVDASGQFVPGLTAGDFTVREDGNVREVLQAAPSDAPLTISLLVDDSQAAQPAIQNLRDGLTAFIEALPDSAEVALATFGERPTPLVEYTTSDEQLKRGINRIFARPGSGAYLLDAIVESSRGLERRNPARPVIVAISMEGVEFSNRSYEAVLDDLRKSGAVLHVLTVGTPAPSLDDETRNRNMVIAEGTRITGGRRDQLLSEMAIPERLKSLAEELKNWQQYKVTYGRPERLVPPKIVEISVNRPGVSVKPPRRGPGR